MSSKRQIKVKEENGKHYVYDIIRRKWVFLTPEEDVRQQLLHWLINEKGYPKSLIKVETLVKYNGLNKRADIICFSSAGKPLLIVECKAPSIKISQEAFFQIATYNKDVLVDYLLVSNGTQSYCCQYLGEEYVFIKEVPEYSSKDIER